MSVSLKVLNWILAPGLSEARAWLLASGLELTVYVALLFHSGGGRSLRLGQGLQAGRWKEIELKTNHGPEHTPFIKMPLKYPWVSVNAFQALSGRRSIGFPGFGLEGKVISGCVLSGRLSRII